MYQAVSYHKRTNTVHIWDDEKGHVQIKYKPYAYRKSSYGRLVALDGQTVDKVYNPGDEEGLYEKYSFSNLVINKTFKEEEFESNYKAYDF